MDLLYTVAMENKNYRETDARFWAGFGLFILMLGLHVFVKEIPLYLLAVPGLLMRIELSFITDKLK